MKIAIAKEFAKEFETKDAETIREVAWAVLNGLVLSYFKAKGECFKAREEMLFEAVKKVVLSLPRYQYGYGEEYKIEDAYKEYFALCPAELVDGLSYEDINEVTVVRLATKVVDFSAENGVQEDGKMKIPDKGVHQNHMQEFEETALALVKLHDQILQTKGEDAVQTIKQFFKQQAEKAVDSEIEFYKNNTDYIVKFYSGILLHSKQEEENDAV